MKDSMLKTLLVFVSLLAPIYMAFAQCGFADPVSLRKLSQRELIVVIEQPSQKVMELMKKKKKQDQIPAYEAAVAAYNASLKQTIEKYWPWDSSANYMTMNDADRLRKTQAKGYVVLYCTNVDNFTDRGNSGGRSCGRVSFPENYQQLNIDREHWNMYTAMEIKMLEDLPKSQPIFRQNLPNIIPEKADMAFGIHAVLHYLQDSTLRARPAPYEWERILPPATTDMQSRTLLLRKDWLAKGLTAEAIRQVYPYPFVIVDANRFNESAMRNNTNLALLAIVPEVRSRPQKIITNYLHAVIDNVTGLPLGFVWLKAEDAKDKYISRESLKDLAQLLKRKESPAIRKEASVTGNIDKQ